MYTLAFLREFDLQPWREPTSPLSPSDRAEARRAAEWALGQLTTESLPFARTPVPVYEIAEALGLQVDEASLGGTSSGTLLGTLLIHRQAIVIDTRKSDPNRLRFTVAHEIGHWLLHRGLYEQRGEYQPAPGLSADAPDLHGHALETQADEFAANLLMPLRLIRKKLVGLEGIGEPSAVRQLAETFAVSRRAMEIRLDRLAKRRFVKLVPRGQKRLVQDKPGGCS